jgi:hypothetical protein
MVNDTAARLPSLEIVDPSAAGLVPAGEGVSQR